MFRIPGPLDGVKLGSDWIDEGTLALTKMPSPGLHFQPAVAFSTALLRPVETRLLMALDFKVYGLSLGEKVQLNERAMFLGQMSVESVKFTRLREDLRYSPERLQDKFPRYVKSIEQARELVAAGSDAIADCVYGPTHKGLNNTQPGDGHRFIGRGYIQLTGRENYRRAGLGVGIDLLNQPELAEQEEIAVRVAVWKWVTDVDRIAAQRGDVRAVTRSVNGGYNNLSERRHEYLRYQGLLRLR